jgi:TetR/AcrR family transcriptional regulator, cholesterol catabolism regulator
MSEGVAVEPARRRLSGKRAETVSRITEATIEALGEISYDELTLPGVATRAGFARATAYIYFSSKEHLIAETYWRRLSTEPPPRVRSKDVRKRVISLMRYLALIVNEEPGFAQAISVAMNSLDPDVEHLRRRISRHIHELILAAVGDDGDDETVLLLELVYTGAMMRAGLGGVPFEVIASQLEMAARRILA